MASTSELDLATLAVTDAKAFLSAFLAKLAETGDFELATDDVCSIEDELSADDVVDGIHIELVHSEGGGEGEGEHVERVFAVNKGAETLSYMRVTGYYASYNGTDYNDDWELVEPREVPHTEYFTVGS